MTTVPIKAATNNWLLPIAFCHPAIIRKMIAIGWHMLLTLLCNSSMPLTRSAKAGWLVNRIKSINNIKHLNPGALHHCVIVFM